MTRIPHSIAVLVGTDCHPFDRIVDWADKWATAHPEDTVTVQYGHSSAPRVASGRDFMSPTELAGLLQSSSIVVLHGGPATISDARKAGHLPLVMPRDPHHGEHVDDHQQRFSRWSDQRSLVTCIESAQELEARVAALAETPRGTRLHADGENVEVAQTAQRLVELLSNRRFSANRASVGAPTVLFLCGPQPNLVDRVFPEARNRSEVAVLGSSQDFWHAALADNAACSCGVPFRACEYWQAVGKAAFAGWDAVDLPALAALRSSAESSKARLMAGVSAPMPELRKDVARYTGYYQALYAGIREVSGAELLIDSSSDPALAIALGQNKEIDLRFLDVSADFPGGHRFSRLSTLTVGPTLTRHGVPWATVRQGGKHSTSSSARWATSLGLSEKIDRPVGAADRRGDTPRSARAGHVLAGAGMRKDIPWIQ